MHYANCPIFAVNEALTRERAAGREEERLRIKKLAEGMKRTSKESGNNNESYIEKVMSAHYEPEHVEGELCWCKPRNIVKMGVYHIEHNEQRVILRALLQKYFGDEPSRIEEKTFGYNEAIDDLISRLSN